MKLTSKFPSFYHKLLPDLVSWEVPDERFADCSNCHLCASDKLSISTTKCCTYHAIFPNYMLGAILSDTNEEWQLGIEKVKQKINNRVGVTPYGIAGTPDIVEFNRQRRKTNTLTLPFAERERFTCPYLDNGRCSVWKYRGELCITYFCNPVSGEFGHNFWKSLFEYIRYIEKSLSLYALINIGYPKKLLVFRTLEHDSYDFSKPDGSFKELLYSRLWDRWAGKEEELYIACHQIISDLSQQEVRDILGHEGKWMEDKCKEQLQQAKLNVIPDGLMLSQENVVNKLNHNVFELTSPKGETIQINAKTYMALKKLDGINNLQDIARESKLILTLPSKRVRKFHQMGILSTNQTIV